jgi:hypothetical protein
MRTGAKLQVLGLLFSSLALLPIAAQKVGSEEKKDPKDALGWFERARSQINLRALGSAPFHMKVKFHALPGIEMLPQGKSEIITGDGVYEETWVSPSQWRREVTLGSYHAIETHSDMARKMEANSDYEPSRVLMLMEALLNPISRVSLSPDLQEHHLHWKMNRSSVQGHSFVRISSSADVSSQLTRVTAYVFLPEGLLLQSNENDIVTTWEDDVLIAGKVVPRRISIQAGAVRDLLTAEVEVVEPGKPNPTVFDLPGGAADPGMTLRPLHWYEVRAPEMVSAPAGGVGERSSYPDMITRCFIDRHGTVRELEMIYSQRKDGPGLPDGAGSLIDATRQIRYRPAEIDGSPCETASRVYWVHH